MNLNHISKSVVGLVRSANEDFIGDFTSKDNLKVYVVCDGMGGHVGGAKASQAAVNSISEYFNGNPNGIVQVALKEAIEFANIQIYGEAQTNPSLTGMGTTCVVLAEKDGLLYLAHVGDSRCYIFSDNKLYRITKDHSYVQTLVDKGEISDAEMESHPRKNELTKALGISDSVEVEVVPDPIKAKKGDKFLLCSDGLTGLVTDKIIAKTIRDNSDLNLSVNQLIKLAEDGGGHDNISTDLIEVVESEHKTSSFVSKNNPSFNQTQTQDGIKEKSPSFSYTKVFLLSVIILITGGAIYYFGFKPSTELTPLKDQAEVKIEESIKLTFENYIDSMNINDFHEDFVNKVENSAKLKEPSFNGNFQIFYFSKEDREMPIDEYREYFGKSFKWNKNQDKRSKDDYLKILLKDSILINHSIGTEDIEIVENNNQDIIIFSEKQQKELDEMSREKAEEEKRKQEEEQKALEKKKKDSIARVEKENKKKKKDEIQPKNEKNNPENEENDENESKNKKDKK